MQEQRLEEYNHTLNELESENDDLDQRNQTLSSHVQELELELTNANSNHEREAALWEEKSEFMEKQNQQAKQDLQDALRKFELTIEQLQKKDNNERNKTESAQMLLISSIEKKYKDQIADIKETHTLTLRDMTLKYSLYL